MKVGTAVVAAILIIALIFVAPFFLLERDTKFGECVGAFDDREPGLKYELSIRNTVIAVIWAETIYVPVIVVANETVCPVSVRKQ